MKRRILCTLLMCLLLGSFIGCNAKEVNAAVKETVEPTIEPTAVPTEIPTATPTAKPTATPKQTYWKKVYLVDEFNESTSEWCISAEFDGTFSNSATSQSKLTAVVFFDRKMNASFETLVGGAPAFAIRLYEYGKYAAHFSSYYYMDDVTIKVKIDGKVTTGNPWGFNDDLMYFTWTEKSSEEVTKAILTALDTGKEVSVVIEDNKYGTPSTYRFTMKPDGLEDIPHDWSY